MSATTKPITPSKKAYCGLQRPHYSAGLMLRDDDLGLAVDYTRDLSRLLFRSLVGCGVVCGLRVTAVEKCGKLHVGVAKGVALDCHGNPIHLCGNVEIAQPLDCEEPRPPCFWILVRYSERRCAPRPAMCASEEDDAATSPVCTRELDGYEIAVTPNLPECACGCVPPDAAPQGNAAPYDCYKGHNAGECGCECGDCDDCDCEWVVLGKICFAQDAKYDEAVGGTPWTVTHNVRRYVRPMLAKDPLAEAAAAPATEDLVDLTLSIFDRPDIRQVLGERLAERARAMEVAAKPSKAAAKRK